MAQSAEGCTPTRHPFVFLSKKLNKGAVTTQTLPKISTEARPSEGFHHDDFEWILREHQAMVYSIALNYLRDRTMAEDLAQDVFLSLYQSIASIKTREHLVFWLRKVTIHRCMDHGRRMKLRSHASISEVPEPSEMPLERDVLVSKQLEHCIDALSETARSILILRYQEDLEPADIAKLLDMPVNTVKSHLRRTLAKLRGELKN
ncbi:MAG TPA: sigma-70 family RNA polymerase sigma factor [Blastocatellia bacterium]